MMASDRKTSNRASFTTRLGLRLGNILERLGRRTLPRDPDVLKNRAREITGLSDFGPPLFMEAYRTLHHSLRNEAQLHSAGERMVAETLLNHLCNRLEIEKARKKHPEIAAEKIVRPVVILGLPRTGSTFLQRLIAADPAFQYIQFKEAIRCAPPPGVSPELTADRYARAERFCSYRRKLVPRLDMMHRITPDSPEECYMLLRNTFLHPSFHLIGPVPSYMQLYRNRDMTESYEDYFFQLQMLQYGRPPRRWILKGPAHWFQVHLLPHVFPDITFIQTHRHPRDVISSWVRLFDAALELHSTSRCDLREQARTNTHSFVRHVQKLADFRDQNPARPFCDVLYKDLTKDPMGQIRKIYAAIGQPLSPDSEAALLAFLERDRADRKNHAREPRGRIGPDDDELNREFASYLARHPGL